ncbi:hypothetical protein J3F84DRAFT_384533 [Trichoderma pleuroticola]
MGGKTWAISSAIWGGCSLTRLSLLGKMGWPFCNAPRIDRCCPRLRNEHPSHEQKGQMQEQKYQHHDIPSLSCLNLQLKRPARDKAQITHTPRGFFCDASSSMPATIVFFRHAILSVDTAPVHTPRSHQTGPRRCIGGPPSPVPLPQYKVWHVL